jgi:hypothetical protein
MWKTKTLYRVLNSEELFKAPCSTEKTSCCGRRWRSLPFTVFVAIVTEKARTQWRIYYCFVIPSGCVISSNCMSRTWFSTADISEQNSCRRVGHCVLLRGNATFINIVYSFLFFLSFTLSAFIVPEVLGGDTGKCKFYSWFYEGTIVSAEVMRCWITGTL